MAETVSNNTGNFDKRGNIKVAFHYNDKTKEYKAISLKKFADSGDEFGSFLLSTMSGVTGQTPTKISIGLNINELSYMHEAIGEMLRGAIRTRIDVGEK